MSYENAPSTIMLATHCAVCARPLRDARSVETGMGPDCRARHGYDDAQDEPDAPRAQAALERAAAAGCGPARSFLDAGLDDARSIANRIVHAVASDPHHPAAPDLVAALAALGYRRLASIVAARRFGAVEVEREGDDLLIRAPRNERFGDALWNRARGRWDRQARARRVRATHRQLVWDLIQEHFAGALIVSQRGISRITPTL